MWKLTLPDVAGADGELTQALTYANGDPVHDITVNERLAVAALYQRYDEIAGQPDPTLNPIGLAAIRDAVRDAYGEVQKGGRLASLRGRLLAELLECPLCGFGEPRTLDHYLPKSEYRSLAIYARNLIPCCMACNRAKGIDVPGTAPGFVHAYFQDFPAGPFLHADVDYAPPALTVTFRIEHPGLEGTVLQRLRHQVEKLGLNDRYVPRINTHLFDLKVSILTLAALPEGATHLRGFLELSAESYSRDFGVNHWKSALMRGLAASEGFCANPQPFLAAPTPVAVAV